MVCVQKNTHKRHRAFEHATCNQSGKKQTCLGLHQTLTNKHHHCHPGKMIIWNIITTCYIFWEKNPTYNPAGYMLYFLLCTIHYTQLMSLQTDQKKTPTWLMFHLPNLLHTLIYHPWCSFMMDSICRSPIDYDVFKQWAIVFFLQSMFCQLCWKRQSDHEIGQTFVLARSKPFWPNCFFQHYCPNCFESFFVDCKRNLPTQTPFLFFHPADVHSLKETISQIMALFWI